MPEMSNQIMTMADAAKLVAPNGSAVKIIEIMSQTNEIIQDAPAYPCNQGAYHLVAVRDDIPRPKFRMINQGSQYSSAATRQYTENAALLEEWAQVDAELLRIAPNKKDLLLQQSQPTLEGMAQMGAEKLFYADTGLDEGGFDGFAMRYNTLDKTKFPEARNVINAGGAGAKLCSIWLVQWDPVGCHLIYPQGTAAGIEHKVFKDQVITDPRNKGPFEGVQVKYSWRLGLAVQDWRRVVRIANVDCNDMDDIIENGAADSAKQKLIRLMIRALSLLPSRHHGKTAFYMNSTPFTMLEIMAAEKSNVNLTYETFAGGTEPITKFKGIPLRRVDALLVGEDPVTA